MFSPRFVPSLQPLRPVAQSLLRTRKPIISSIRLNSTTTKPPNFFRLSYLWYGFILASGASSGFAVRNFAAPLALPIPGSREDELALDALRNDVDKLDIVTFMRSQCSHAATDTSLNAPEGEKSCWIELDIKKTMTEATEDLDEVVQIATGQTMAGSRGLGIQRAFWNTETRELIAVVWIGGALAGWPTVAHGGIIATIFEDAMSRMIAGPDIAIHSIPGPLSMNLTYAQPSNVLNFYILRANYTKPKISLSSPSADPAPAKWRLPFWKDLSKKGPDTGARPTLEIIGTLENVKGQLLVRAKGTFPVSAP